MPVGGVVQHGLEVGRAGGEHHLVRLELQPLAGQGDVNEGLRVEEVLEDGKQVVLVVVPPQAVLLGRHGRGCGRGRRGGRAAVAVGGGGRRGEVVAGGWSLRGRGGGSTGGRGGH